LVIALVLLFAQEAPLIGRPVEWPFSGAIAGFVRQQGRFATPFALHAEASPRTLASDEPLTLTLTVRALGPVKKPPARLDLGEIPAFAKAFHLSDLPVESDPGSGGIWRWRYQLVPRGPWVSEVPSVPFLFYNPDFTPPERGYQLLFAEPIPLSVRAPEKLGPPPDYPPSILEPVADAALGRSLGRWDPGAREALVALVAPPLGCLLGWWLWRHWFPDAARQAALRKGRAARVALDALERVPRDPRAAAEHLVVSLTAYLRDRYQLRGETPTPTEVDETIARAGQESLAARVSAWWRQADAVRFGRESLPVDVAVARQLLIELEEAACRPSS
jgi:hypothetical protein